VVADPDAALRKVFRATVEACRMTNKSELGAVLASCRGTFLMAALFSSVINILMVVPSLYMMQVYDRVLHSHSEATLFMLTLITVGLLGTMSLLEVIRSRILVRIGGRLDQKLGERVLAAQFSGSLQRLDGNPGQAMRDFDTVRQFLTGSGIFAFFDAPWAPMFLAIIFLLHPLLGLISLAGGAVLLALAFANNAVTKKPLEAAGKVSVALSGAIDSSLRNAEVIEAMGMFQNFRHRWAGRQSDVLRYQAQAADRAGIIMGLTKYTRLLLQTAMLGGGAWLAINEQMSAGCIIASSVLMGRALAPVEQAIGVWKQFLGARVSYRRLTTLLRATAETTGRSNLPRPTGSIGAEGLCATPPGRDTPSLSNLAFELESGQVLGIIGPSGAGKSTLARLLVGAWRPDAGTVCFDGIDIQNWDAETRGTFIGYLPQDVELFDGTIAENISRFGVLDDQAIVAAARRADVHDLILHLALGYDTPIGRGGSALSGGQRQRIGLARAVFGNPAIVVLDEPNSNLDDSGGAALVHAVSQMKAAGTTVVIISHRPSILSATDQIMVLEAGKIRLFGARAEVLAALTRRVVTHDGQTADQMAGNPSRPAPAHQGGAPRDQLAAGHGLTEQQAI
jgi:PrtD family type I secretion system ABC transporter